MNAFLGVGQRFGPYRIIRTIGDGGMGTVFEAEDNRLDRRIALKVIHQRMTDTPGVRERFQREARLAARVNHPGICQVYDVGDTDGRMFIALELLQGEALSARLSRGPLPVGEATRLCLSMSSALAAMHDHGVVHRDLKPSNIFLTPHGVKLLDFGVARSIDADADTVASLTSSGAMVGTPRYMAPEQVRGAAVDARADLFALGVVLYEMLTGVSPFEAPSLAVVLERILNDDVPVLGGSFTVGNIDRIIHRCLAKQPSHRYASASEVADDLRSIDARDDVGQVLVTAVTRLIVLPFRLLRRDPDVDFLSFGLADAVASSLAAIDSLVVRPTLMAGRQEGDAPDLKAVAEASNVDVVLHGTLLRAGTRIRVAVQLADPRAARLIWADTYEGRLDDIFRLQDDLSRRIVESLAPPLSGRERRTFGRDVPASAAAYEHYLRANELVLSSATIDVARDMYLKTVELDPGFAPAWARLGHLYRVTGKYRNETDTVSRAEAALNRALELNPELSFADRIYAQVEVDYGRSKDAMARLTRRAAVRANDPELFAGLVHSCRYCGLFDASVAAHARARRLDPKVKTSVQYTFLFAGDYDRAIAEAGGYDSVAGMAMAMAGHPRASAEFRAQAGRFMEAKMVAFAEVLEGLASSAEGDVRPLRRAVDALCAGGLRDPEAFFVLGLMLAGGRDLDRALELVRDAVDRGFWPLATLDTHPWLEPLRGRGAFVDVVEKARALHGNARLAFHDAGGGALWSD